MDDDEGQRLLRIIRRGSGSVVTWWRAQMVLLSVQGMPVTNGSTRALRGPVFQLLLAVRALTRH
jgi:hypothetical protein